MRTESWLHLSEPIRHRRLGVMRCCWGQTDFEEHCRISAELGAGYVEDFAHKLKGEVIDESVAQEAIERAGIPLLLVIAPDIDCTSLQPWCDRLAESIERWQRIGLTTYVVLRSKRGPEFGQFLRSLKSVADVVRRAGLTPLTQNHVGGAVETAEELAACVPTGVDLLYDTQQFPRVGEDALGAWDRVGPHVRHVHLGDRDLDGKPCPFGQGVVRMADLLRRIHAAGYRGAMTIETEHGPKDATARPIIAEAMAYTREVLEPLGAGGAGRAPGHAVIATDAAPAVDTDWGRLHWISNNHIFADCEQTIGLVTINAGCSNGLHRHPDDQEVLYVRSGRCRHVCGDRELILNPGDVLFIPAGQTHGATAIGEAPCEMVVTYPTGARSFEAGEQQESCR